MESFLTKNIRVEPAKPTHSPIHPAWRLLMYLAMVGLIGFPLVMILRRWHPTGTTKLWSYVLGESAFFLAVSVPAMIMARIEKRSFSVYGLGTEPAFGRGLWRGGIWGVAAISLMLLAIHLVGGFDYGGLALHGAGIAGFGALWALFFLLVGFTEEFAFRGYTQFTLAEAVGFWPAAVVLSLLFGGLHLQNIGESWVGALSAACIGLFACFTLRRTGNLGFAIGLHAAWDWGETFFYAVPDSGSKAQGHLLNSSLHGSRWLTGGGVGPEGSVFVFVLIAGTWLLFDRLYPATRPVDR